MHEIWISYETPLFNFDLITNFLLPPLWLIPLGVVTADPISPLPPVFYILPRHPSRLHILPHNIHISSPRCPSLSPTRQFHPQHFCPMCAIFLLCTCPSHLSLSSLTLSLYCPICAVPLTCSILILSIPLTPNEDLGGGTSDTCFLFLKNVGSIFQTRGRGILVHHQPLWQASKEASKPQKKKKNNNNRIQRGVCYPSDTQKNPNSSKPNSQECHGWNMAGILLTSCLPSL